MEVHLNRFWQLKEQFETQPHNASAARELCEAQLQELAHYTSARAQAIATGELPKEHVPPFDLEEMAQLLEELAAVIKLKAELSLED